MSSLPVATVRDTKPGLPCPHCGRRGPRLNHFDEVGSWLWSTCCECLKSWGWPDPPTLFDEPPTKES